MYDLKKYLPTTRKEMELRGWDSVDVIIFTGDAYVDHPSFGAAILGRVLEREGYRVAIVPQPDWHGDLRDFKKLGRPNVMFMVTSGSMDSMVNHYTAAKRLRHDDAYTPDGRFGMRPDRCVTVYTRIIKSLFPDVPVSIGGIEASMRRLTHYDYWDDRLMPSILADSGADVLQYGMGEASTVALARAFSRADYREDTSWRQIPQIGYLTDSLEGIAGDAIRLHSHEEALADKRKHAENFRWIETESNKIEQKTLVQGVGQKYVVINPSYPPMTTEELDAVYDLPYMYYPHPKYKGKTIPAYEMIRWSVCMHRGCFGGCSFCTISAHQGKQISSRSKENILRQIRKLSELPDWHGVISDLGGPSANMYQMHGVDRNMCHRCARPSCLQPSICRNLNQDFLPLIDLLKTVDALPYVKHCYVGSGIRYDLMNEEYGRQLITRHVSGRLKVAPEHTSDSVLRIMRKPSWDNYLRFRDFFLRVNEEACMHQQLIPYFISSHPGCTNRDMAGLGEETRRMNYRPEQVQDFTPTPMTLSTTMFYTGLDPYTMQPVYVARTPEEKRRQNSYFFWWKPVSPQKTKNHDQKKVSHKSRNPRH